MKIKWRKLLTVAILAGTLSTTALTPLTAYAAKETDTSSSSSSKDNSATDTSNDANNLLGTGQTSNISNVTSMSKIGTDKASKGYQLKVTYAQLLGKYLNSGTYKSFMSKIEPSYPYAIADAYNTPLTQDSELNQNTADGTGQSKPSESANTKGKKAAADALAKLIADYTADDYIGMTTALKDDMDTGWSDNRSIASLLGHSFFVRRDCTSRKVNGTYTCTEKRTVAYHSIDDVIKSGANLIDTDKDSGTVTGFEKFDVKKEKTLSHAAMVEALTPAISTQLQSATSKTVNKKTTVKLSTRVNNSTVGDTFLNNLKYPTRVVGDFAKNLLGSESHGVGYDDSKYRATLPTTIAGTGAAGAYVIRLKYFYASNQVDAALTEEVLAKRSKINKLYTSGKANAEITKAIKDYSSKYLSKEADTAATSNGKGKLLVWTNLALARTKATAGWDDYVKAVKKYDKSDFSDGFKNKNDTLRYGLAMDMFTDGSDKTISPVFATKSNTGHLATLAIGSSSGTQASAEPGEFMGVTVSDGTDFKIDDVSSGDIKNGSLARGTTRSITAADTGLGYAKSNESLGIDNLGTIIIGDTLVNFIPYWQNTMFLNGLTTENGKNGYFANPNYIGATQKAQTLLTAALTGVGDLAPKNKDTIADFFADPTAAKADIDTVSEALKKAKTFDAEKEILTNGTNGVSHDKTLFIIAALITNGTNTAVSKFNKDMVKDATDAGALYNSATNGSNEAADEDAANAAAKNRWTAANIIKKIGFIFDYGFYETFRLTITSFFANLYNTGFVSSSLNSIFYTPNITESTVWIQLIPAMVTFFIVLVTALLIIYIVKFMRRKMSVKDIAIRMVFATMFLLIPYVGYGMLSNYVLNKPAQAILNGTLNQTVILDLFLDQQKASQQSETSSDVSTDAEKTADLQESYAQLFNTTNSVDSNTQMATERNPSNYILYFYTNTTLDGLDLTKIRKDATAAANSNGNDNSTSAGNLVGDYGLWNGISASMMTTGKDWDKTKLVKIGVRLSDLFAWSTAIAYQTDDASKIDYTAPPTGPDPTANGIYALKTDDKYMTLFNWLATKSPNKEEYTDADKYTEYQTNTNKIFDAATAAKGGLISTTNGGYIDGSELFYTLDYLSLASALKDSIMQLGKLAALANTMDAGDNNAYYVPTAENEQELLRDYSMVSSTRATAGGLGMFSTAISKGTTYKGKVIAAAGVGSKDPIVITAPTEDYFNVYKTVMALSPYQANTANPQLSGLQKSIERMTYNINQAEFHEFLNNFSLVPSATSTYEDNKMKSALWMGVTADLFFKVNKELGFKNFPKEYVPSELTFDTYLKMIYTPMKEFNVTNSKIELVYLRNVVEYLSLRENMFVMFLFIIALILLLGFGIIYLLLFYGTMLVLMMVNFVYYYVISADFTNKSWLGSAVIYGTFGLIKAGLVLIWYIMTKVLNTMEAKLSDATTYTQPYPYAMFHTLVIIIYLLLAFKLAILPIIKSVIKDPHNLGGSVFSDKFGDVYNKISNKISGGLGNGLKGAAGRSKGLVGSSLRGAKRAGKGLGKGIGIGTAAMMGLGSVNARRRAKTRQELMTPGALQDASDIKAKVAQDTQAALENQQAKAALRPFASTAGSKTNMGYEYGKSVSNPYAKITSKHIAGNKADSKLVSSILNRARKGGALINGVAATAIGAADTAGKLYGVSQAGKLAAVNMGTAAAAQLAVAALNNRGIAAKVKKGTDSVVSMDSTDIDFNDRLGRDAFAAPVASAINEAIGTMEPPKASVLKSDVLPYTQVGNKVRLRIGADGLSGKDYARIIDSKFVQKNFVVDPDYALKDMDGNLLDDSYISLIPKNASLLDGSPQNTQALQQSMMGLVHEDTQFRKKNGLDQRKSTMDRVLDAKALKAAGLPDADIDGSTSSGMYRQGDDIIYSSKDKYQSGVADNLLGKTGDLMATQSAGLKGALHDTLAFADGGSANGNVGLATNTVSADKKTKLTPDEKMAMDEFGISSSPTTRFNSGRDTAEKDRLIAGVQALNKVGNLSFNDTKAYTNSRDALLQTGKAALVTDANGSTNYEQGVSQVLMALGKNAGTTGTAAYRELSKTAQNLAKDTTLSEAAKQEQYAKLFATASGVATGANLMDGIASKAIMSTGKDKQVVTDYLNQRESLAGKMDVSTSTLDSIDLNSRNDLNLRNMGGNVESIAERNGVAKVTGQVDPDKLSAFVRKLNHNVDESAGADMVAVGDMQSTDAQAESKIKKAMMRFNDSGVDSTNRTPKPAGKKTGAKPSTPPAPKKSRTPKKPKSKIDKALDDADNPPSGLDN